MVEVVARRTNNVVISTRSIVAEQRFEAVAMDHIAKLMVERSRIVERGLNSAGPENSGKLAYVDIVQLEPRRDKPCQPIGWKTLSRRFREAYSKLDQRERFCKIRRGHFCARTINPRRDRAETGSISAIAVRISYKMESFRTLLSGQQFTLAPDAPTVAGN